LIFIFGEKINLLFIGSNDCLKLKNSFWSKFLLCFLYSAENTGNNKSLDPLPFSSIGDNIWLVLDAYLLFK